MIGTDRIVTPDGRRVPHAEWTGGLVLAYDKWSKTLVPALSSPAVSQGKRPVMFIRTKTGREMTVTWNHPLLTERGWKEAATLWPGDKILSVASYAASENLWNGEEKYPWLLGALLGDGCLTKHLSIRSQRPRMRDALEAALQETGWTWRHGAQSRYLLAGKFRDWIRSLGLYETRAASKFIPDIIMQGPVQAALECVAGLIDTDGHISDTGRVTIVSVSETMLRDVQHLLLRAGIQSNIREAAGADNTLFRYHLQFTGENLSKFNAQVKLRSEKQDRIDAFLAVPKTYRSRIHRHGDHLCWEAIEEIHSAGEAEVFSIEVPGYQNYVAEDVIQHNSAFFSWAYPIWQMDRSPGYDKENYGYIFSGSASQAEKLLRDIIAEVESNPRLAHLIPKNKRQMWGSQHIRCANGHMIYAKGWGTKTRGAHPRWIILDDILNDEDATSEQVRQKNIEYFKSAIIPMVPPGGQLIIVGTPYAAADLYAAISGMPSFSFHKFAAINEGKPLWPDRYDKEKLLRRRDDIGSLAFAREYLCEVVDAASSLFPVSLTLNTSSIIADAELGMPRSYWMERGIARFFVGVDFAISANVKSDATVIFTIGLDQFDNRWVVNIRHLKGAAFQDQIDAIRQEGMVYAPEIIALETNQMQKIFEQELSRVSDLPIRGMHTGTEKHSLREGVPAMRLLFENQKYKIPRGSTESVRLTDLWLSELAGLTIVKGRVASVATHDDFPMAQYICEKGIRSQAFTFSFEPEPGDNEVYQREMAGMQLPGVLGPADLRGFDSGDAVINKNIESITFGKDYSVKSGSSNSLLAPEEISDEDRVPLSRKRALPEKITNNELPSILRILSGDY